MPDFWGNPITATVGLIICIFVWPYTESH